ncbi:MAG: hypothetical protein ACI4QG_00660, partial [Candidatus Cryptobacteroides sp.]
YDIESIEILKDASATAIYGSRGAAGVVIIRTKKNSGIDRNVGLRSNLVVTGRDVGHNHYLNAGGSKNKSSFNFSLFYKNISQNTLNRSLDNAGMKLDYETRDNKVLHFGASMAAAIGKVNDAGPQQLDYEDNAKRYAATASSWIQLNFGQFVSWKTVLGADYRNVNRSVWYGFSNPVGAPYNGLAAVTANSSVSGNVRTSFDFSRYFASHHKLDVGIGGEFYGNLNDYASLAANDYFADELRAKGISIANSGRVPSVRNFSLAHLAAFVRAEYSFRKICGVEASFRLDRTLGSSRRPFDLYPAADAWLDIRNLALPSSAALSELRLEAGYGISGNELFLPGSFAASFQKVHEWNAGIRAGFADGRVSISAKYFDRKIDDVVPFSSKGVEASLNAVAVKTGLVEWRLRGNAAYLRSDCPLARIRGYEVDSQGNYIDPQNSVVVGNSLPAFYGGVGTSLSVWFFRLDILADYAGGFNVVDYKSMREENRSIITPRYVCKGDYLRLSSVSLSGSIPVGSKVVRDLTVTVGGRNVLTLSHITGRYLEPASFVLGLKINF